MLNQYVKFLINGGVIGLLALLVQAALFYLLGAKTGLSYAFASVLTYIPLILLNFKIQEKWIFASKGRLWRFCVANITIMILVSALSPLCRAVLTQLFNTHTGDLGGFILASLIGATPSFLLNRIWVFAYKDPHQAGYEYQDKEQTNKHAGI